MLNNLDNIKKAEFNILKYFSNFCELHQLNYVLIGGTLLGAIRHKGLIPWDDDIDVGMPRDDYDRLLKIWSDNDALFLQNGTSDPMYAAGYSKIIDKSIKFVEKNHSNVKAQNGVFIDVFPFDSVRNNKLLQLFEYAEFKMVNMNIYGKLGYHDDYTLSKRILLKIMEVPFMFSRVDTLKNKREKIITKPNKKNGFCLRNKYTAYGFGAEKISREDFINFTSAHFEGTQFRIPRNWDNYLKNTYGDYMKLPKNKSAKHLDITGD